MAARKKSATKKTASKKTASKKSASKKSARKPSDALALLRQDHQMVQQMFDQFERTRGEDRKAALAEQICRELSIHAQIEEEIFYPAAREALRDADLIDEAAVEHQSAKDLIAQIEEGQGSEMFEAKVKVLGEYVRHHVREEHNEIFPQVRKAKLDLKQLGEQLQARKMELMEGGGGSSGRGGGGSAMAAKTASSGKLTGSRGGGRGGKTGGTERSSEGMVGGGTRGIDLSSGT